MDIEDPIPLGTVEPAVPPQQIIPGPAPVGYDAAPNVAGGIQRVRWNHMELIDFMLQNPIAKNSELAAKFGYTQAWISRIISSDAFREKYIARKKEICPDAEMALAMQETEERFRALADEALARLQEKLPSMDVDQLLKTADMSAKARGFGIAKGAQTNVNIQQSYVVALPEKAKSADDWLARHGRAPIEVKPEAA